MKTTDYFKHYGPGPDIQPGSRLLYVISDPTFDYRNATKITLNFERHSSKVIFQELRDFIIFSKGDTAQEVIKALRGLADRLNKTCVLKVGAGRQCPHCQEIFYNYTKRRKIYCSPLCQNSAGVKRLRAQKKEKNQ